MPAAVGNGVKVYHLFVAVNLAASFLAAQRYALPELSVYLCVVPLLSALYYHNKSHSIRLTFVIWALFLSLDSNLFDYPITAAPLRYLIYIYAFFLILDRVSYSHRGLAATACVFFFYILMTFASDGEISRHQFVRDIIVFVLAALLLLSKNRKANYIDVKSLYFYFLAFLSSELVNIYVLYDAWYGGYMSYDTTKHFVVFASFYALSHRSPLEALAVIAITMIVLIAYVSRVTILIYVVSLMLYTLFISRKSALAVLGGALIMGIGIYLYTPQNVLESYKATNMINIVLNSENVFDAYRVLDRVRYDEHVLFFSQNPFSMMFGNGFGAAIYDREFLFHHVSRNQSAFSVEELESNYFVNFHDMWIDVGFRFGLIPLVLFLYLFFSAKPKTEYQKILYLISFVGFFTAFYSTAGLLLTFIFAQNYRLSRLAA